MSLPVAAGPHRYRLVGLLGSGGFGRVYRARLETSDGFHKDVAIKLLHDPRPAPEVLERFREEARTLARIRDRAVVGVEPPVQLGDRWAVVMDLAEGAPVSRVLRACGPLPAGAAAELVGEVARTLHTLYSQPGPDGRPLGILHRDLKPSNLHLSATGEVRVLDFGLAVASSAPSSPAEGVSGTLGYVAPERLRGVEGPPGDVYSLGRVLHELVRPRAASEPPCAPATATATATSLEAAGAAVPDPQEARGDPIEELAEAMCHPEPARRPTARQVERRCAEIARAAPPPGLRDWAEANVPRALASREPDERVGTELLTFDAPAMRLEGAWQEGPRRGWPRRPWLAGGLAAGVLLGGGVGGWLLTRPLAGHPAAERTAPEPVAARASAEPTAVERPPEAPPPTPAEPTPAAAPVPPPSSRPRQRPPAPAEAPPDPPAPPVQVFLNSLPASSMVIDGTVHVGSGSRVPLSAGPHVVELATRGGASARWEIEVSAERARFCYDFATGGPCPR